MDLTAELFSPAWQVCAAVASVVVGVWLARNTPWQRLATVQARNLLFGLALVVALFWIMRAGVQPGLNLHMLGAMAATLALGPHLAIVAMALALTGVTFNGNMPWLAWPINFIVMVVLPVVFADFVRRQIEQRLPNHFYIYIFCAAFMGAALTVVFQGLVAAGALWLAGSYSLEMLTTEYLPYFALLGFAEAWLSGAFITVFVVYKPEWVHTFDDARYLAGK